MRLLHNCDTGQRSGSALRLSCPAYEGGRRPCDQRRRSPPAFPSRDGADRAALGRSGRRSGGPPDQKAGDGNSRSRSAIENGFSPTDFAQRSYRRLTPAASSRDGLINCRFWASPSSSLRSRSAPRRCGFVSSTRRFFQPSPRALPGSTHRGGILPPRRLETRHAPPEVLSAFSVATTMPTRRPVPRRTPGQRHRRRDAATIMYLRVRVGPAT